MTMDKLGELTPQQQRDLHRKSTQDARKLAQEITHFLRGLHNSNLKGEVRGESGLWNCLEWLPMVLMENDVQSKVEHGVYGQINRITFTLNDGTFSIAECELDIRMGGDEASEGDSNPHYMGNLLQLSLHGTREDSNYRVRVRWLAYDGDTAVNGMPLDEFEMGDWQFPDPTWCNLLGEHSEARDWLTRTKLRLM